MNYQDEPDKKFALRKAFKHLQAGLLHDLGAGDISIHPTTKGDNAELNWINMLDKFLPKRYAVKKAFVVDVNDNASQQLDVVIYDVQYSPLLFEHKGALYVPAESVYAVFEVKQELDKLNINYAAEKISSVRGLERTSAPIPHAGGNYEPVVPKRIIGGVLATRSSWSPPFGASLVEALNGCSETGCIDLGCAVADGAFEYVAEKSHEFTVREDEDSLLFFALRLFHQLQMVGTVPAIDVNRWQEAGLS